MASALAVSPSVLTPGLYLVVDLLAGTSSPGTGMLRVVIMASKSSDGDLTHDTEVRAGAGEAVAAQAFGRGTVGHLAAKLVYRKYPAAQVDFVSVTPGSGVATLNLTLSGAPASDNVLDFDVMGRSFEVPWAVGETVDDIRDKIIDVILSMTNDLACTAVSGGAGIATLNSKVPGNVGNDILVDCSLRMGSTGTEAVNGSTSVSTSLTGATTDPNFTTALQSIEGQEYHVITPCLSNYDVANTSSTNNLKRIVDHIDGLNTGLNAKLQQFVVGYTGSLASATASAPDGNSASNAEFGEMLLCVNGRGLPGELGGRETGGRIAEESLDPAANRIGEKLDGYIGAKDKIADRPTLPESESALGHGVSLVSYTAQGIEQLVCAVTTHSQDDVGGPDRRLLDVQNVSATYIVARDIRNNLPLEFPNAKITRDIKPGEDPPPKGVIQERDIRSWIIVRLRFWQQQGVLDKQSLDDAIADGTLIVRVNDSDPRQVDIVLPFKIVQPLAKFGVVAQRLAS